MPRPDAEDQSETLTAVKLKQLLAGMGPESRETVLRIFQREALQEADEVLNGGRQGDTLPQSADRASDRKVI